MSIVGILLSLDLLDFRIRHLNLCSPEQVISYILHTVLAKRVFTASGESYTFLLASYGKTVFFRRPQGIPFSARQNMTKIHLDAEMNVVSADIYFLNLQLTSLAFFWG